ncbi:hypothetical protein APSETT444_001779 [Aspergillus pseudonomiae]
MKTSVISLIGLAAVAAAAAVQPGAHSNTNAVPNIVVSPPGDGNGAIDNTVRPNDNNRLGQYWMQYGDTQDYLQNPVDPVWEALGWLQVS